MRLGHKDIVSPTLYFEAQFDRIQGSVLADNITTAGQLIGGFETKTAGFAFPAKAAGVYSQF